MARAYVTDHSRLPQFARGDGDSGATGAQHLRDHFVGQKELVRVHAVVDHQQERAQPLFDRVQAEACGHLRHLGHQRLRVE